VELHQHGTSTDSYFDLSIEGIPVPGLCAVDFDNRGPYLQIPTPSSVIVRWETNEFSNSIVKYGTDPNNLNNLAAVASSDTAHIVQLSNLQPNTKYYYSVGQKVDK